MVDKPKKSKDPAETARIAAFVLRWEQALKMNGVENATIANALGPNGQQNIRGWKDRGHIGAPSERAVQALLPLTNMDWLQYGDGSPERLSSLTEPSLKHDVRQARSVRPVPEMLSAAYQYALIGLGLYAEARDLNLAFLTDAGLLCDVYALIAGGGGELPGGQQSPELQAIVEKYTGNHRGIEGDVGAADKQPRSR